jgi:hypothetical protein
LLKTSEIIMRGCRISALHQMLFRVGVQQNSENTQHETPDTKPY